MHVGSFFIGWERLSESERIDFGLAPWPRGYEVLCVEWRGHGTTLMVRPR